ncbi:5-hydroxytryptamine receptor 1 [Nymphon striatum]|nr:5-hydroxytryptamine receptor 1 [Nymphon striatum]
MLQKILNENMFCKNYFYDVSIFYKVSMCFSSTQEKNIICVLQFYWSMKRRHVIEILFKLISIFLSKTPEIQVSLSKSAHVTDATITDSKIRIQNMSTTIDSLYLETWELVDNISSSVNTTNSSSTIDLEIEEYGIESFVIITALGILIVATIIGNVLVCLSVILVSQLRHPSNYLLTSLAVSDLGVAILVMPFALYLQVNTKWRLGYTVCNMWVSFDVYCCTASILNLCMISIDRYLAITNPLRYGVKRTPTRMALLILLVWIFSALVSLPPLFILGNEHGQNGEICRVCQNFGYQLYATFAAFYIPLIIIYSTYIKIWAAAKKITDAEYKARQHIKAMNDISNAQKDLAESRYNIEINQNKTNTSENLTVVTMQLIKDGDSQNKTTLQCVKSPGKRSKLRDKFSTYTKKSNQVKKRKRNISNIKDRKASVTLGIIMSVFTICWLPFFLVALIGPLANIIFPDIVHSIFLWLGYANSMLNPVIYATFHKDFRKPFKEILCFRCGTLKELMREEYYHFQYGNPERSPAPTPVKASRNGSTYECQVLSSSDAYYKDQIRTDIHSL